MFARGYCVMHIELVRDPGAPGFILLPEEGEWETTAAFAADRAITWWDRNPVFTHRHEAEHYARLAPVETEIVPVEYTEEAQDEREGWFDSFRAPHWFRVDKGGKNLNDRG